MGAYHSSFPSLFMGFTNDRKNEQVPEIEHGEFVYFLGLPLIDLTLWHSELQYQKSNQPTFVVAAFTCDKRAGFYPPRFGFDHSLCSTDVNCETTIHKTSLPLQRNHPALYKKRIMVILRLFAQFKNRRPKGKNGQLRYADTTDLRPLNKQKGQRNRREPATIPISNVLKFGAPKGFYKFSPSGKDPWCLASDG